MAKFKNVSPLGALDIDVLGLRGVKSGEEFEVPDELASMFVGQVGTFEGVEVPPAVVAEWDAYMSDGEAVEPVAIAEPDQSKTRKKGAGE
ncbi:hypothetical protein [Microbacterium rhizomatis]|uniref:Uncharacterized protein n=1 Tax=Microbacterium rhizomatis TaxID=1631477 RepID=A0A5J5J2S0_9MICO|nr:hypothetical protein [Microbacterium rhizomatis]KAA9110182.1 hypothetical protein F6B43_00280 [Microbacterium rhizomatis]